MKRLLTSSILMAFMPSIALAHGGEVMLLPLGQILAVFVATILLWPLNKRSFLISISCTVGVALSLWFILIFWLPESFRDPVGLFLVGFFPPLAVVGLIIFVFRGFWYGNKKSP